MNIETRKIGRGEFAVISDGMETAWKIINIGAHGQFDGNYCITCENMFRRIGTFIAAKKALEEIFRYSGGVMVKGYTLKHDKKKANARKPRRQPGPIVRLASSS